MISVYEKVCLLSFGLLSLCSQHDDSHQTPDPGDAYQMLLRSSNLTCPSPRPGWTSPWDPPTSTLMWPETLGPLTHLHQRRDPILRPWWLCRIPCATKPRTSAAPARVRTRARRTTPLARHRHLSRGGPPTVSPRIPSKELVLRPPHQTSLSPPEQPPQLSHRFTWQPATPLWAATPVTLTCLNSTIRAKHWSPELTQYRLHPPKMVELIRWWKTIILRQHFTRTNYHAILLKHLEKWLGITDTELDPIIPH